MVNVHIYTRSTHAYDASRRSKRHVQVGRAVQVSGVSRLGCEESPVHAMVNVHIYIIAYGNSAFP